MAAQYLSTTDVARVLGVSVTTVKRWVDQGVLPAQRTAGGHRKLLLADVLRLAREQNLPCLDPSQLTGPAASPGAQPRELQRPLRQALLDGDEAAARSLLHNAFRSGTPLEVLADTVIAPVFAQLGHDWETGRIEVLHEHRATQICAAALYGLKPLLAPVRAGAPRAVGGAPEDDPYFLPSLLAQLVLSQHGWEAVNLGPDTPLASLRRALVELRPRLLWLSVSHLARPAEFLEEYAALYQQARQAGTAVAVGGRGLPADVRVAMPYTMHGDGLVPLAELARALHPLPRPQKRGRPPRC
jgi:excisionase family DNA binding protein